MLIIYHIAILFIKLNTSLSPAYIAPLSGVVRVFRGKMAPSTSKKSSQAKPNHLCLNCATVVKGLVKICWVITLVPSPGGPGGSCPVPPCYTTGSTKINVSPAEFFFIYAIQDLHKSLFLFINTMKFEQ